MNNGENTRGLPIQIGSSIDQQWRGACSSINMESNHGQSR
jgi:hypothetical protein